MNNSKNEVQKIEYNIEANLDKLKHLKRDLSEKFTSIKTSAALTEMLVMGFTLGYMIMPGKKAINKPTRLASVIIILKIRKMVRAMTSYLFK